MVSQHDSLQLILCIGYNGLGLLHTIFTIFSILVSRLHMLRHNFCCTFFCFMSLTKPDHRCLCSCDYIDVGWPVIEIGSF
jgi:hypothetical protein